MVLLFELSLVVAVIWVKRGVHFCVKQGLPDLQWWSGYGCRDGFDGFNGLSDSKQRFAIVLQGPKCEEFGDMLLLILPPCLVHTYTRMHIQYCVQHCVQTAYNHAQRSVLLSVRHNSTIFNWLYESMRRIVPYLSSWLLFGDTCRSLAVHWLPFSAQDAASGGNVQVMRWPLLLGAQLGLLLIRELINGTHGNIGLKSKLINRNTENIEKEEVGLEVVCVIRLTFLSWNRKEDTIGHNVNLYEMMTSTNLPSLWPTNQVCIKASLLVLDIQDAVVFDRCRWRVSSPSGEGFGK